MAATRRVSYRSKRRAIWEQNAEHWGPLASEDPFRDWQKHRFIPESSVEDGSLCLGLDCMYAGDVEHARLFYQRAIAVADRLIAEDKCRSNPINEAGYPHNLAAVIRGRAYSRWLLENELNRAEMRQVAEHITAWCLTKATDHKRFHSSMTMNYYMEGVRAAMVACDLDLAADYLKAKHQFRWHHGLERALWTRLIAAYPDVNDDLKEEVEAFFNRVRDPDFEEKPDGKIPTFINRDILALETGIIRQMYVINDSALDPVAPEAVIEAVAK